MSNVEKTKRKPSLFARVVALVEEARHKVATVANLAQVYTNFEIGRQIVEEEQGGKRRADYGKQVLIALSQKLTARFGRGWSAENLRKMRTFFLMYSEIHNGVVEFDHEEIHNSVVEIQGDRKFATVLRKSDLEDSANTVYEIADVKDSVNSVSPIPKFTLSWSHYLLLMRIADPVERAFYEREATQGNWSFRQLERMYRTSTFERLQISKDKAKVRALMNRPAPDVEVAGEALKDPVVTEFLGTPDKYSEGELEDRIFDHIQDFMLEMGKGFTFHGRQVRCVIGDHCAALSVTTALTPTLPSTTVSRGRSSSSTSSSKRSDTTSSGRCRPTSTTSTARSSCRTRTRQSAFCSHRKRWTRRWWRCSRPILRRTVFS